jgi:hypothetical protein
MEQYTPRYPEGRAILSLYAFAVLFADPDDCASADEDDRPDGFRRVRRCLAGATKGAIMLCSERR